jgi:hypothetical protein
VREELEAELGIQYESGRQKKGTDGENETRDRNDEREGMEQVIGDGWGEENLQTQEVAQ